jgi:hypothetical protein
MTDYLLAYASGDPMVRLRAAREVAEMVPDSDWFYKLGASALRANRPQEAVDALERIDPTRGWMEEWTSYWVMLLHARHALGDCQGEFVDSALAIYQALLADSVQPVSQTYCGAITCDLGVLAARRGDRDEALRLSTVALEAPDDLCPAMIAAELGDGERAVTLLRDAISHGFTGFWYLHAFPSFQSLQEYAPFEEIIRPKG